MEEVVEATKMAGIHSYIKRLPDGYDTIINEDGMNISKGKSSFYHSKGDATGCQDADSR